MLVQLLILGIVAQTYGRPQEASELQSRIRVPDPNCLRAHQLLPHEYDCTKFYYCEDGFRFIEPRDCAPGTEFSVELEVCIHPSLAKCALPGVPTASPTTRPTAPSTTPTTSTSTTTTTTTTKKPEPSPTTVSTESPSSSSTQNPSPGETLPNGCPADFGVDLLLPHEYDCGRYYQCVHGVKIPRPCAPGLHFNFTQQECLYPELADCTLTGVPTGGPSTEFTPTNSPSTIAPTTIPTAPSTAPTTTSTGSPSSPSTQNPSPGETLPNGCPADFGVDLLLPHEYDCGQYYQCVHGVKIPRPCAPGLHFNFTQQECLYPELADCTLTGVPTGGPSTEVTPTNSPSTIAPTTIPTAPSTAPTTISTGSPSSSSTQNPSPGETLPNGCPADFGVDLLLPHEYDCGQYYQCVHGVKIPRPCAPGLHFNFTQQECLYPALADCTLTGVPTGGPSTEVTPTNSPSTIAPTTIPTAPSTAPTTTSTGSPSSPSTQNPSPGETLPNGCPADFGVDLLLPHEYDCGQYYQCVHGVKIPRPCAPGLHFNFTQQECLYPELADCTLTGVPTGGPSTEVTPTNSSSTFAPTTIPTAPSTAPTTISTGSPSSSSTQNPSPGETLPNGCPADFGVDLLLPHEYDCGQYYQCVHGVKIPRPCAPGLHFNFTQQECLYPELADCTLTGVPTGGPSTEVTPTNSPSTIAPTTIPTAPSTAPTTTSTGSPSSPSTQNPSPGETLPNGCPADFGVDLLLPHEYDCGQYYQCVHGVKIPRPCAPGLHFNFTQQECLYPELADCTLTGVPTGGPSTEFTPTNSPSTIAPTTIPTAPSTAPTTTSTGSPSSPSTQNPSPGETLPNGCPADFGVDLLLPHEYDCGQYYQCVHGVKIPRPCAPGLHFNFTQQECLYPELADCTLTGVPTGGPSTEVTPTNSSSTFAPTTIPTAPSTAPTTISTGSPSSSSTQNPSPGETLPNGCPADFGVDLLLPHEYDCGRYYQCVHGVKIPRPCAPGLHFNFTQQECLYPELADCTLTGVPTGGPSTEFTPTNSPSTIAPTTIPTAPSTAPTTTSTGSPSSPSTQNPSPGETLPNGCPADFGVDLLLPHEYDCGQYYQCVHGVKIPRPCAPGLHFNFTQQECLYPELADCTLTGVPTGGPSTEVTPTNSPSTIAPTTIPTAPSTAPTTTSTGSPSSPSTQNPSPGETLPNGCPADFGVDLLLPHEYDCGQYYQCVHGVKIPRPCAPGLHFNFTQQECLYPEIANCISTVEPTASPSTNSPSTSVSTAKPTVSPTAPTTTSAITTTTTTTTTSTTPEVGDGSDNKCKTGCNVPHWSHETDCDKFWHCNGDQKALGICSTGLHFNPLTQTCDFICNVACERKSVQTNYNADGLSVFLPWEKVDKFFELNNRGEIPNLGFALL